MSTHSNRAFVIRMLALVGVLLIGGMAGVNKVIETGPFPRSMGEWKAAFEANMKMGPMFQSSSDIKDDSLGDPDEIVVPIIRQGRQLFVQVELSDVREGMLLIDTGATETILSTDLAFDLGLLGGDGHEMTYQTAGGEVHAVVAMLDRIRVGEAEVHNVVVAVQDLPGGAFGDGLLGMSFFEHFNVKVDSATNRLYLRPR